MTNRTPKTTIGPHAHLAGADMEGTRLVEADLCWANLRGANLRGANLTGANLKWTDFRGADIRGANLTTDSHNLHCTDFRSVVWDKETVRPEAFAHSTRSGR